MRAVLKRPPSKHPVAVRHDVVHEPIHTVAVVPHIEPTQAPPANDDLVEIDVDFICDRVAAALLPKIAAAQEDQFKRVVVLSSKLDQIAVSLMDHERRIVLLEDISRDHSARIERTEEFRDRLIHEAVNKLKDKPQ